MRCILAIDTGPAAGESLCIRGVDVVQIGRTEWADHCIADDPLLSRVHFVVESEREAVRIRDLGSANGTWVNGMRIETAELRHGDVIRAGESSFRVQFDRLDRRRAAAAAQSTIVASSATFPYNMQTLRSGVQRYVGGDSLAPRATLLKYLREEFHVHLLVNFKRAGIERPGRLDAASDLMHSLPAAARRENSLFLVGPNDGVRVDEVVEQTWGRDALCVLLTKVTDLSAAMAGSYAHFARPSLLRMQLEVSPRELTSRILATLAAVLVEGESPRGWKMYANPDVAKDWKSLSLPIAPQNASDRR